MGLLTEATGRLFRMLQRSGGVRVTYHPAGGAPIQILAVPARSSQQVDAINEATAADEEIDWIVDSQDDQWVGAFNPQKGDVVRWKQADGTDWVYVVTSAFGENVARPTDQYQRYYRIHSKREPND